MHDPQPTATPAGSVGKEALASAGARGRGGLGADDFGGARLPTWIGSVEDVEDVRLPRGARIVALVRGEEQIIMADDDTLIETDDHVIVFAPTRRQIPQIEGLFQVSAAFF